MRKQSTLIIGANSEIGKAIALQESAKASTQLIIVSRNIDFYQQPTFQHCHAIATDSYQQQDIDAVMTQLAHLVEAPITRVFICHGVLHSSTLQPEKKLSDFNAHSFTQLINSNTLTPMLWLQALQVILAGKTPCKMTFFTARVASISDNRLGGWYSYRASKAALNMLLKSAAVELARSTKNIKLISFHPGTTDTPLSKPFQRNVPQGKLFTAQFVAEQLARIVDEQKIDGQLSFVDWRGESIPF